MAALRVGGIVLCGGRSTRMGAAKATLPFGRETMLARVVRLLSGVVQPIVVVAAPPDQELPPLTPDVRIARDRESSRGPLEGLAVGLAALVGEVDAAYVTSCDVPLLVPDFVRAVISRLQENDIAAPVDGDLSHPLAAIYRTRVLPQVESLLSQDSLRTSDLLNLCQTARISVDELRAVDPELHTLLNLNRPEDYQRAVELLDD